MTGRPYVEIPSRIAAFFRWVRGEPAGRDILFFGVLESIKSWMSVSDRRTFFWLLEGYRSNANTFYLKNPFLLSRAMYLEL